MATTTLDSTNFGQFVMQDGIVIVDCWAPWCGPCKMFGPVFEATAEKFPQHMFAKLNTDDEKELSQQLQIQSIPTLMIFRQGILLFRQSGAVPGPQLEEVIGQVEALDMAEVRTKLAEKKAQAEQENAPSADEG